jgi:hypothetical protein
MKIYVILMFLYNFSIRLWNCSDGVVFFVFPYIRKIISSRHICINVIMSRNTFPGFIHGIIQCMAKSESSNWPTSDVITSDVNGFNGLFVYKAR